MNTESKPVRERTSEMIIGKTTYIVTTHYNENARETAEDQLFRLVTSRIAKELTRADPADL